jgi:hypothetical protein
MHWPRAVRACHILTHGFGYLRTVARQECVGADGHPIPWYRYAAQPALTVDDDDVEGFPGRGAAFTYRSASSSNTISQFGGALAAVESLRAGGVIILDNSDWFPRTSERLRTYDVIEVDMSGSH